MFLTCSLRCSINSEHVLFLSLVQLIVSISFYVWGGFESGGRVAFVDRCLVKHSDGHQVDVLDSHNTITPDSSELLIGVELEPDEYSNVLGVVVGVSRAVRLFSKNVAAVPGKTLFVNNDSSHCRLNIIINSANIHLIS